MVKQSPTTIIARLCYKHKVLLYKGAYSMPRQNNTPSTSTARTLNFAPPVAQVRNKVEGIMDKSNDLEELISFLMEQLDMGRADLGRQIIYTGLSVIGNDLGYDIVLPEGKNKYQFQQSNNDTAQG